jgi:hypothetical protein
MAEVTELLGDELGFMLNYDDIHACFHLGESPPCPNLLMLP